MSEFLYKINVDIVRYIIKVRLLIFGKSSTYTDTDTDIGMRHLKFSMRPCCLHLQGEDGDVDDLRNVGNVKHRYTVLQTRRPRTG